jgi:hypothetical protein
MLHRLVTAPDLAYLNEQVSFAKAVRGFFQEPRAPMEDLRDVFHEEITPAQPALEDRKMHMQARVDKAYCF